MFFVGFSAQIIPFLLPFIFALLFLSGNMKEEAVVAQTNLTYTITYQQVTPLNNQKSFHFNSAKASKQITAPHTKTIFAFVFQATKPMVKSIYQSTTYNKDLIFASGQKAPPIC